MGRKRIENYADFWPFYLRQHSDARCRAWHYTASIVAIVMFVAALRMPRLWLWLPICAYGCAWIGHFVYEKNRPATFEYPWWSLKSDFRMFFCWLTGSLDNELAKAGVPIDVPFRKVR